MTYIYIFEDGKVGVSGSAPGPEDLESIGDGRLEVLKMYDRFVFGVDYNGVDQYTLPDADWYDETTKRFHTIH